MTEDALGVDEMKLDGLPVAEGLQFWLDNPCASPGPGCASQSVWSVAIPTTTTSTTTSTSTTRTTTSTTVTTTSTTVTSTSTTVTSTTTTTTTLTSTSTTVTSTSTTVTVTTTTSTTTTSTATTSTATTSTTTTSSTTTTTTTWTMPVAPQSVAAKVRESLTPQAFYDELELTLSLDVNTSALAGRSLDSYGVEIAKLVAELVNLKPPSGTFCKMKQTGSGSVEAAVGFVVIPGSNIAAVDVRRFCREPGFRDSLNRKLETLGMAETDKESSLDAKFVLCHPGALFCCVQAVVSDITKNAGVLVAYRLTTFLCSFIIFGLLLSFVTQHFGPDPVPGHHADEERRGWFVFPLLIIGALAQAGVCWISSYNKYTLLAKDCELRNSVAVAGFGKECPPDTTALIVEAIVIGQSASLFIAVCSRFWYRQWRADCAIEESPAERWWRPVTPLESIKRRSHLLQLWELREEDNLSMRDLILATITEVLMTYAVVLTSFFMLQAYSVPGVLVAWHPYKLLYELIIGSFLRQLYRTVALEYLSGILRMLFSCTVLAAALLVNVGIWTIIIRVTAVYSGSLSFWSTVRIMDIALGAGLANYLIAQLGISLILRLVSAYYYEPRVRHHFRRCLVLYKEHDVKELQVLLSAKEDAWKICGVETPRRVRKFAKEDVARIRNAAPGCAADELRGLIRERLDIGWRRPFVIQLHRKAWYLIWVFFFLDGFFGVEKHLPVEPRDERETRILAMLEDADGAGAEESSSEDVAEGSGCSSSSSSSCSEASNAERAEDSGLCGVRC